MCSPAGIRSPKKRLAGRKPVLDISDGQKASIRNTIYDMYKNRKYNFNL